jgi:hypothetical protein
VEKETQRAEAMFQPSRPRRSFSVIISACRDLCRPRQRQPCHSQDHSDRGRDNAWFTDRTRLVSVCCSSLFGGNRCSTEATSGAFDLDRLSLLGRLAPNASGNATPVTMELLPPPETEMYPAPRMAFSHIGLYVSDIATMVAFYTGVLGFSVRPRCCRLLARSASGAATSRHGRLRNTNAL